MYAYNLHVIICYDDIIGNTNLNSVAFFALEFISIAWNWYGVASKKFNLNKVKREMFYIEQGISRGSFSVINILQGSGPNIDPCWWFDRNHVKVKGDHCKHVIPNRYSTDAGSIGVGLIGLANCLNCLSRENMYYFISYTTYRIHKWQ